MYNLQDFVTDLPMQGLRILTKPSEFSQVRVNSISVQELPLDTFVQPDEIILSTLIGCLDNSDIFKQFIKDIKNSGAAALVVCFKDPAYQPDTGVVSYAMEIGLPLLCLPWEVRFADVIHHTTQQIHEKNIESYKYTRDSLFTSYFSSQSLDKAATILSRFFDSPVAIAGKNMVIKGRSQNEVSTEECAMLEIRMHSFLWGYLYICQPEKCANLLADTVLLEKHIMLPLSLWFNKENIEDMIVLRMKNDFVWDLANKNYSSFLEMVHQGTKLGFNLSAPHVCVAFSICAKDPSQLLDEYSPKAAQISSFMEDIMIIERKRRNLNIMFADRGLQFIAYVEVPKGAPAEFAEEIVDSLDKTFVAAYPDLQIYWGISGASGENSEMYHQLCQSANLALRYCMNDKSSSRIFTYKDTKFQKVISELSSNKNIKKISEETLEPLIQNDKNSSMDLVGTLIEFIRNNGNTSLTARNLHLNRQSLLYRLKKIESLTGMSLNERKDLLLLELFTRIQFNY